MNKAVIESLFALYKKKGFLTNDEIFSELVEAGVSIVQTERICSELLSRGVFISDEKPKSNESSESQTETEYDAAQIDYEELYTKIIKKEPSLKFLVDYVRKVKPAQKNEVDNLYPQIKSGNKFARNRLFEMNMRNVLRVAYQKAIEYNLSLSDTVQNGMIGLHVSIDKFDIAKHDKFQGYSTFWILNYINRNKHINDSWWVIPAHAQELHEKIYKYICKNHESFFVDYRISNALISEIQSVFEIDAETSYTNLRMLLPIMDIDDISISINDSPEEKCAYTLFQEQIHSVLNTLPPREQEVLKMRFGLDDGYSLTLDEVGEYFDVTRERIRQIEAKALRRLRHPRRAKGLRDYIEI